VTGRFDLPTPRGENAGRPPVFTGDKAAAPEPPEPITPSIYLRRGQTGKSPPRWFRTAAGQLPDLDARRGEGPRCAILSPPGPEGIRVLDESLPKLVVRVPGTPPKATEPCRKAMAADRLSLQRARRQPAVRNIRNSGPKRRGLDQGGTTIARDSAATLPVAVENDRVTRINPTTTWPGLGLAEAWRFRAICLVLTRRTLMVRYRQTALGAVWTVLQPLLLMIVFTVFFGLFVRAPNEGLPHAVFYYLGILPWFIVVRILAEGSNSVVAGGSLINRVYFPRIYFPAASALASLVDFAFGLVPLVVLLVIYHITPTINIVFLPFFVLVALMTGLGVALWFSSLNAQYRDITQLLPSVERAWFFCSPVLYPSSTIPKDVRWVYYFNPAALVIDGFRWAFANTPAPPPNAYISGTIVALVLLVTGYLFFRNREPMFADVV
jgi:lipopolysaccharide transport system permease protein